MGAMDSVQLHRSPSEAAGRGVPWILVVDDEVVVRDLLERFLVLEGYNVMAAADGVEAVRLFQTHRGMFRAVILDVVMPRMDGPDTFAALRQIDPSLPMLIMSGFVPGDRADAIVGKPGTSFIHKPFVLGDVLLKLEALLRDADSPRDHGQPPTPPARYTGRLEGITD